MEERVKIDRRKLEQLIPGALPDCRLTAEEFFHRVMKETDTVICWPERLKIGSKSKKDPQVKIEGGEQNVIAAKDAIMQLLDIKRNQVTLRMDISHTDHSHLIGKRGETIQKVKSETDCHIHFPDSNRNGTIKSNRVTLTGHADNVEKAREEIRYLMPIVLKLNIPISCVEERCRIQFSSCIKDIQEQYLINIRFNPPNGSMRTIIIRGQQVHYDKFLNGIQKFIQFITLDQQEKITMEIEMAISPSNHSFLKGPTNYDILKFIMQSTHTTIRLPQNNDSNCYKFSVQIIGHYANDVYQAWLEIMKHLQLSIEFNVKENRQIDIEKLNKFFEPLNIIINIKQRSRQNDKTVIITSFEKFSKMLFEIRKYLINEEVSSFEIPILFRQNLIDFMTNISPTGCRTYIQLNSSPHMIYSTEFGQDIWSQQPFLSGSPDSSIGSNFGSPDISPRNTPMSRLPDNKEILQYSPDISPRNTPVSNLSDNREENFHSVNTNISKENCVCDLWNNQGNCSLCERQQLKPISGSIWSNGQLSPYEIEPPRTRINFENNPGNTIGNLQGREIRHFDNGQRMLAFRAMKQNPVSSKKRRPTNFWCGGGFSKSMHDAVLPTMQYTERQHISKVEEDPNSSQDRLSVGTSHKGDNFFSTSNCFESLSQKPAISLNQDIKDLCHLLTNLNLERYMNNFLFHEIDFSAFLTLNDKDLKELGISKSARDKMLFAISALTDQRNLQESSPNSSIQQGAEPLMLRLARQRPSPMLGDP